VGLRDVRYGYHGATNMGQPKDQSSPYFDFDPSKCIVCSRCVRACQELQGTFALTIEDKGFDRRWPPRREKTSSAQNVFPAALVFRPARQRPSSKRRSSKPARPIAPSSPPAPIVELAALSTRKNAECEDKDRRGPRSNLFKLFGCYWREVT